jgi:serine/threonine protein kinase
MEKIKILINKINLNDTNLNGSKDSFDCLTIQDVYEIAESKIKEMCFEYNMTNFLLPKINGRNSLVIYADSIMENKIYKYSIKIYIYNKNEIKILDTSQKLVSDNNILPKIYYDYIIDYNSKDFIVKINVSERLIPFYYFKWTSVKQIKNSIITLIEKTIKLHSLGLVHNDIKYENIGLDSIGNIFLFDFDNFSIITKSSCLKIYSSSVCHPPDILINSSILNGLGNCIIDLFSICCIILGDIIRIHFWRFDNLQLYEKNYQIINFKRNKIFDVIQRKIYSNYKELCLSQFWFSLINFLHLVFQKNIKIKNKRAFIRRAKKLITRMKNDLE